MATTAQHIAILERYFTTGGELGPISNQTGEPEQAMRALTEDGGATWLPVSNLTTGPVRAAFARAQIFERTLSPPSLAPSLFVRPSIQIAMFEGLHKAATGGAWKSPDPAGVTPWLGTVGGSQYALETMLTDPPRMYRGKPFELPPQVIAAALILLRDAALPLAWFTSFGRSDVFERLEVRAASSAWSVGARRTVLALTAQTKGRVTSELAMIASKGAGGFPSFPAGDGLVTPTSRPAPRAWYRSGWMWAAIASGLVGGGLAASR